MTEQMVRRGANILRFTVSNGPEDLDAFRDFFSGVSDMYGVAWALSQLHELAESGESLHDPLIERTFDRGRYTPRPGIQRVSMRSPLEFDLTAVTQSTSWALSFLFLLLKAPEKLANLPTLHAHWHKGRLQKEIVKAQRDEFRRRLRARDVDLVALNLDIGADGE